MAKLNSPASARVLLDHVARVIHDTLGPDEAPAVLTIQVHESGSFSLDVHTNYDSRITFASEHPDDRV